MLQGLTLLSDVDTTVESESNIDSSLQASHVSFKTEPEGKEPEPEGSEEASTIEVSKRKSVSSDPLAVRFDDASLQLSPKRSCNSCFSKPQYQGPEGIAHISSLDGNPKTYELFHDCLVFSDPDLIVTIDAIPAFPLSSAPLASITDLASIKSDFPILITIPLPMSLASSLPSFLLPFANTKFVQPPDIKGMKDEEGMDKARSHILEGLHYMNESLERENVGLNQENDVLVAENGRLLRDLDGYYCHHEELKKLNEDIQAKINDECALHVIAAKELEEATKKVSNLNATCYEKDVRIKKAEIELVECQTTVKDQILCIHELLTKSSTAKQEALFHQ
ncbi:unnamed protein product [Lactuca virosa]|uniref:Uncharacterized protein n=1 Tax=Lactuca virosa TaxID=75947 RepID=A0AAU9P104_9ASTR|nr:unnamed protein product [Lactuca virosa]